MRVALAAAVAIVGSALVTLLAVAHPAASVPGMLYLLVIAGSAAIGGMWVGVFAAVLALVPFDYFFTPPGHTLGASIRDVVAALVFAVVGAGGGALVDRERRARDTAREARAVAVVSSRAAQRLQRAAEVLSMAVTPREVLDAVLTEGVAAAEAGAGLIALLNADGTMLEVAEHRGYDESMVETWARFPVSAEYPLSHAVRTGEPVFLASERDRLERFPALPRADKETHALACLPLIVEGRTIGGLAFSFGQDQEFDADRRALKVALARQAAQALDRARLYEALQRSQSQATRRATEMRQLQTVTAALSQAATVEAVADTCLEHAIAAVGADAGLLGIVRGVAQHEIELVAARGYSPADDSSPQSFSVEARLPLAAAIRTGEPVWGTEDETAADLEPSLRSALGTHRGSVAVPLRASGVRGAFQLAFSHTQELSDEDRAWLQAIAVPCAQALERSRLLEEEQRLRSRSERLQSLTSSLSGSLTQLDAADVVVRATADEVEASGVALAVVDEEEGALRPLAWEGYEDGMVESWLGISLDAASPVTRVVRDRRSTYVTAEELERENQDASDAFGSTGHESLLVVPLVAGGRMLGVLAVSWMKRTTLWWEDKAFLELLASQAAQALDRARHFESERTIAETLQRSVLPESLPSVDGVQLAARYLPGTADIDVGGDWFDAILLPNGRLGLVVGDVVGKGVQAAATMGQLRNAVRAFAFDQMRPSSTVARTNRLADDVPESAFATMVYVVVEPETRICRFASAGHPPLLVLYPDGRAEFLEGGRGLPLGAGLETYPQDVVEVPTGTTLLLYTDGLIERRGRTIDDGLEKLRRAALDGPGDPEQLLDHLLDLLVGIDERPDDIALLAVRLLATPPQPLHLHLPSDVGSLDLVRDALRVWLEHTPASKSDVDEIVLATWEACANAVEHGRRDVNGFFSVAADWDDSTVLISVEDSGRWTTLNDTRDAGLGLTLMRSLMSSVEVEADEGGTRVRLVKDLAGQPSPT